MMSRFIPKHIEKKVFLRNSSKALVDIPFKELIQYWSATRIKIYFFRKI